MDENQNEKPTSTPNTQFGVLDLLLLTLSIGYVCGLIALGQNTSIGTGLMRWLVDPFSPLAELWPYAPLATVIGVGGVGYLLNESNLAPRLFLRMYLVTMLTAMGMTACFRMTEIYPVPIVGTMIWGAFLFLPLWLLHHWCLGNRITAAHWCVVLVAALIGVGPIVFLMPDLYMRS